MSASNAKENDVIIRFAKREDCVVIKELKKELAEHDGVSPSDGVGMSVEGLNEVFTSDKVFLRKERNIMNGKFQIENIRLELQRDGFDTNPPCYRCLLAEIPNPESKNTKESTETKLKVVGYALYFYAFSACEGKALYLKDICVTKAARGQGLGSKLIKQLAKIALEENCARIQLEVHEFNYSGQKFYDSHGGRNFTKAEGWHKFSFEKDAIERLVGVEITSI